MKSGREGKRNGRKEEAGRGKFVMGEAEKLCVGFSLRKRVSCVVGLGFSRHGARNGPIDDVHRVLPGHRRPAIRSFGDEIDSRPGSLLYHGSSVSASHNFTSSFGVYWWEFSIAAFPVVSEACEACEA